MSKGSRSLRIGRTEPPKDSLTRLEEKEVDTRMRALAKSLSSLRQEEVVDVLSELDLGEFRVLLKYYMPSEWVVERVHGRRLRMGKG